MTKSNSIVIDAIVILQISIVNTIQRVKMLRAQFMRKKKHTLSGQICEFEKSKRIFGQKIVPCGFFSIF